MSIIDIRQLVCFVEVAKHESFTKAAESLYLTQPTISKMIKSLEEEMEVTLIKRSTKRVELTDVGRVVLQQSQKIVESMQNLENELNDVLQLRKGTVNIGIPAVYGGLYFSPVVGTFSNAFPQIEMNITEDPSGSLKKKLISGELDICALDISCLEDEMESWEIYREPLVLIVPKDHLFSRRKEVSLEETKKEKWVFFAEETGVREVMKKFFSEEFFKRPGCYKTSRWDFAAEMVISGLGISILPEAIVKRYLTHRITAIPITEKPELKIVLSWKRQRYLSYAARQWLEFNKNYFSELH